MIGHPKPVEANSLGSSLASEVSSLEEFSSSLQEESSSSPLLAGGCLTGRGAVFLAIVGLGVHLPVERDFIQLGKGGRRRLAVHRYYGGNGGGGGCRG